MLKPGEQRVEQDGHDHGLGAAEAVAQNAEDHAADCPADHEDHGGVAGLLGDHAGHGGVARLGA